MASPIATGLSAARDGSLSLFFERFGPAARYLSVSVLSQISVAIEPHEPRRDLETPMELILIVLVVVLLFGGGGFWGYRRWR
jgi:hypothetical protein